MPRPHQIQRWTTPPAIAAYLGVCHHTVLRAIRVGALRACSLPSRHYTDDRPRASGKGNWRIYENDLADYLTRVRAGTPLPGGRGFWRK